MNKLGEGLQAPLILNFNPSRPKQPQGPILPPPVNLSYSFAFRQTLHLSPSQNKDQDAAFFVPFLLLCPHSFSLPPWLSGN